MNVKDQATHMLMGHLTEDEIVETFAEWDLEPLTGEHVVSAAQAMRDVMIPVDLPGNPIDTCGTGGSGLKTINTSTLVACIVAAAGGKVAKHGNRSASGNCGSFDVLEALGAVIDLTREQEQQLYKELGLVFLFAPNHHPTMRFVKSARKRFGKKTVFNLLGPLCNPAGVRRQMIGTSTTDDAALIASALRELGADASLVVTGSDGLDEVTVCDTTTVLSVHDRDAILFDPSQLQIDLCLPHEIEGGSVEDNVAIIRDLAAGGGTLAHRSLVLCNAAHALLLTGEFEGLYEAFAIAQELLASGRVGKLMDEYVEASSDV